MTRPHPIVFFRQSLKSEAYYAYELINIYLLRPLAAGIVWLLYPTSVTPNQVTIAAVVIGFVAAFTYTLNTPVAIAIAGVLVMLKDIVDDADGQLARAKSLYSRRGRFLDSIGDFVVDVAVFAAITKVLYHTRPMVTTIVLGIVSLAGITLRVSYHVFYQVSFLHLESRYGLNRIVEDITEADRHGDPVALQLQKIFTMIYSWQDRLMNRLDCWCMGGTVDENQFPIWYGDRFGLRLSGLLGFGTELTLLAVCSWFDALALYILLNLFLMNGIWLLSMLYRRVVLRMNLSPR